MTYPEQYEAFDAVLAEMAALHRRKAEAYGANAIGSTGLWGIVVRMNDKVHRLLTLTAKIGKGDPVSDLDESIDDTLIDLASYAVIALVWRRGRWGKL